MAAMTVPSLQGMALFDEQGDLKLNDEKTTRVVRPEAVGEMEYHGKKYLGMRAFCLKRNEERTFRIDRILEIEVLDG